MWRDHLFVTRARVEQRAYDSFALRGRFYCFPIAGNHQDGERRAFRPDMRMLPSPEPKKGGFVATGRLDVLDFELTRGVDRQRGCWKALAI